MRTRAIEVQGGDTIYIKDDEGKLANTFKSCIYDFCHALRRAGLVSRGFRIELADADYLSVAHSMISLAQNGQEKFEYDEDVDAMLYGSQEVILYSPSGDITVCRKRR